MTLVKEIPYVVVHGGVHKTATSYLQSILQRNAGRLKRAGVYYVHHRDTRKEYTYPCQLNGYEKLGLDYKRKYSDKELKEQTMAFFRSVNAKNGARIILSDENMPGHCGQCVRTGELYQRRETLIPIFAGNIPYPVREVYLAIRDYGDFFASAYIEFLRSVQGAHVIPEIQMKRAVLSNMPSWTGFVDPVRTAFPGARLVIWRHEDFGDLSEQIIGKLCGPDIDGKDLTSPKRSRGRPSASHRAVQVLQAEIACIGADAALARRVEIQEAYPRGPDWSGYDPWTAPERAHLTRLYDRDVTAIRSMPDVEFIHP